MLSKENLSGVGFPDGLRLYAAPCDKRTDTFFSLAIPSLMSKTVSQTWIILWNRKTLRPVCPWHPFSTAFDFTFFFIFFVTFNVINNFCRRFPAYASNAHMIQIMCYHVPVHSNGQSSFLIQSLNFRLRQGLCIT